MTATDLLAALVVEKFLAAIAETGLAKRENILAAAVETVTKQSRRTTRSLSAMGPPTRARADQVICSVDGAAPHAATAANKAASG